MPDLLPDVTNFYNAIRDYGISKKYNFKLEAIEGTPVDDLFSKFPYDIYAQSTRIPSKKINTVKIPYKSFEYVVPMHASYPDNESWELTFITDANLTIRTIFENWNKALYDSETNSASDINFAKSTITFNLLKESIDGVDGNGLEVVKKYVLKGAYPVLIGISDYDISSAGDSVSKTRIIFAFQSFTTN